MERLVQQSSRALRRHFGGALPRLALVLGSGFDPVTRGMRIQHEVSFADLPGFPSPRVPGHPGRVMLGELGGTPILVCRGRPHFYEGLSMEQVMFPIRVLAAAGIADLLLTNAAGGINPRYTPGDFMLFADHINFTGVNPLRGFPSKDGSCFLDLSEAYSPRLRKGLKKAARETRLRLHEGVYLGVSGPAYETPAEIRAFRRLGADAVGMSAIPEVLIARWCGLEVAALSCITNRAAGLGPARLSHQEVLAAGRQNAAQCAQLLTAFARTALHDPPPEMSK